VEREGETQDRHGVHVGGGSARDPGAQGAATDEERKPAQFVFAEPIDHGRPGRVQLVSRSGGPAACHAIRLLDERDAQPR
jgi:hypothetical protein